MKNLNLICGDTIEEMKKLKSENFDLIVTSPPYNKSSVYNAATQFNKLKGSHDVNKNRYLHYDEYKDNLSNEEYENQQKEFLNECERVLKPGGSLFYNHKPVSKDKYLIHPMDWISKSNIRKWMMQEIFWDNGNRLIHEFRFHYVGEKIYWFYKRKNDELPKLVNSSAALSNIWKLNQKRHISKDDKIHPVPFCLRFPLRCILSLFPQQENLEILDPYCGSGTVGVAAFLTKNNFTGIDISKKYIEFSKQRIENYESEKHDYAEEISLHKPKPKLREYYKYATNENLEEFF